MTAEEMRKKAEKQGLKVAELAEKAGVCYEHMRKMLNGKLPMTERMKSRIELILSEQRTAVVVFSVSLPDGTCSYHLHAPEKLTDTERQQVMQAVKAKIEAEM